MYPDYLQEYPLFNYSVLPLKMEKYGIVGSATCLSAFGKHFLHNRCPLYLLEPMYIFMQSDVINKMLVYDGGYQFIDNIHRKNYYLPPPGEEHHDHQHQHLWELDCAEYELDKVYYQNPVF